MKHPGGFILISIEYKGVGYRKIGEVLVDGCVLEVVDVEGEDLEGLSEVPRFVVEEVQVEVAVLYPFVALLSELDPLQLLIVVVQLLPLLGEGSVLKDLHLNLEVVLVGEDARVVVPHQFEDEGLLLIGAEVHEALKIILISECF